MLVNTCTTFAIRCAHCGKLELNPVSRFAFGRGRSINMSCSCGGHALTVSKKHGQIAVQVPCYLCDGLHFLYFASPHFWSAELKQVACAETDLQLGVFGPQDEVEGYVNPWSSELDLILEDEAFDEYFDHRDVMYQTLTRVHSVAAEGNLRCACGSRKIGVDIYPDRLELTCPECGRHKSVAACSPEDLATLMRLPHIEVGDDPSPNRRQGHKK